MRTLILAILLIVSVPVADTPAAPPASGEAYARRIIGRWVERKIVTYRANGTWTVQKTDDGPVESHGMRWRVEGEQLILISPYGTNVSRIVAVDRERLVTETAAGERLVATRYRPPPRSGGGEVRRSR